MGEARCDSGGFDTHADPFGSLGFKNIPGLFHAGVPQGVFFAISFAEHLPLGSVTFHESFKANDQRILKSIAAETSREHTTHV